MSIAHIELAHDTHEIGRQFHRGLALVDTDAIGLSDHVAFDLQRIAHQSITPIHRERNNQLRELVASGGEIPPVFIRPSGLLQARFEAIGMNIADSLFDATKKEPVSVEDGYFLWYMEAGDSLKEHIDDTSGYGLRIGYPLGGLAVFEAANHRRGILGSPSLIVQNLASPLSHGAMNLTPGRLVPIWDIETK